MVKFHKFGHSISINKAPSVEQAFVGNFLPNFNGKLSSGRKIKDIDLLPRELLGLMVASVPINISYNEPYTVGQENYLGLDGVIVRQDIDKQKHSPRPGLFFEQVYVLPGERTTFLSRLQQSLNKKISRGHQYTDNVNLIILTEENVLPDKLQEAIGNLKYEMIIQINALPPKPFHFDFYMLRNNELNEEYSSLKIYIDKLTGLQQAVINKENYLVINGQAAKTYYPLPLRWKLS